MVLSVVLARLWVGDVAREDLRQAREGGGHVTKRARPPTSRELPCVLSSTPDGLRERLAVPGVVGPEGDHHLARGQRPLLMRVHDEALPNQAPPAVPDCPALHS